MMDGTRILGIGHGFIFILLYVKNKSCETFF